MENLTELISLRKGNATTLEYPKIIFSFSSKSLAEIDKVLHYYVEKLNGRPILLSLYDIFYTYDIDFINNLLKEFEGEIYFDSGQYEAHDLFDLSEIYFYEYVAKEWNEELYLKTFKKLEFLDENTCIVNYDLYENIDLQMDVSFKLFGEIDENIRKIFLAHSQKRNWDGEEVEILVRKLEKYLNNFNILGITEKELGNDFFKRIGLIFQLRRLLNTFSEDYIPIHIFGCNDPKSVIYYFLAGADVFDGLNWLRYYFNKRSAFYKNEFFLESLNDETLWGAPLLVYN